MRCIKLIVAALGMLLVVAPITQAGITYTILNYPADQNGATVTGTITTDGAIGVLSSGDILGWSWEISNAGGLVGGASSSSPGSFTGFQGLVATATQLTIPIPTTPPVNGPNLLMLAHQDAGPPGFQQDLQWERFQSSINTSRYIGFINTSAVWDTTNPAIGGTDPWVIAAIVPEPSSFLLAVLGAVCVIASGLARSRGVARTIS